MLRNFAVGQDAMNYEQLVDRYFLEHRAKLLDIAAFLDRLDRPAMPASAGMGRTTVATNDTFSTPDFRIAALRQAIALLIDGEGERARRVLELFSDPTTEPVDAAPGTPGGAAGAWKNG